MLKIKHLSKKLGKFLLDDISFDVPNGYIMGVIGENGAGKSSLIKCIMNIYSKDAGEVIIDDLEKEVELDSDEAEIKQNVAVILEKSMYEESMTCFSNAKIVEKMNGKFSMDKFLDECAFWNIDVRKKVCDLSKGTQIKFQAAMATALNPKLIIMDEPLANLDEESREQFKEKMRNFVNTGEKSIVISSHLTKDLEKLVDYVLYLHRGKVLVNDDIESLLDKYLIVFGDSNELKQLPQECVVGIDEGNMSTSAMIEKNNNVFDLALTARRPTLEDIMYYMNLKEEQKKMLGGK